ncbi:hypothetical protein HHI36_009896 [Cryptolaemus montrouzieri]|uniref:Zasp-like motif domain-containing protein n=1 Tax=Cryptolaemus montrouzieri TaxID=559131 RepID=A0ABD2MH32_9CUCU
MNLLQRSIYSQQPQAALIIVKAYPVYLSPVQNNNMNRLGVPNLQNAQLVQYNPTPKIPLYTSTESIVPPRQHIYNHASGSNSNLYYANSIAGNPNLNQLAQLVAQQYSSSPSTSKTPAIITGLENFSAEQQSQIKTYLKNYIDTHSEETPQPTEVAEHREIMTTGDATQRKYSDKLSQQQFIEQTDWRPSHQVDTSVKNFGDKS